MSFARLFSLASEAVTHNQLGRESSGQLITPHVLKNWDLNVRVSPDDPELDLTSRGNDKTGIAAVGGACVISCIPRAVRGEKGKHRSEFAQRTDFAEVIVGSHCTIDFPAGRVLVLLPQRQIVVDLHEVVEGVLL